MRPFAFLLFTVLTSTVARAIEPGSIADLKLRAEAGDGGAQNQLAERYLASFYFADAVKWSEVAVTNEIVDAHWRLGEILLSGKPAFPKRSPAVTADPPRAIRHLTKAANGGHIQAQVLLGQCYAQGRAVAVIQAEAYKWFAIASSRGNVVATALRDQLALKISTATLREGDNRATAFTPRAATIWDDIVLQGLSLIGSNQLAIINGKSVAPGETVSIKIDSGTVRLRCTHIKGNQVGVMIGNQGTDLTLSGLTLDDDTLAKECQSNLKKIADAKARWAADHKSTPHAPADSDLYYQYIPAILMCPKGGSYLKGELDQKPSCSFHVRTVGE
jgi:hypothetical protein